MIDAATMINVAIANQNQKTQFIFFLAAIHMMCSCNSLQKDNSLVNSGALQDAILERNTTDPIVHFELLSDRTEKKIGDESYVLVLPETYQTDGTAACCVANIQHAADVSNALADTNHLEFPYIKYQFIRGHLLTWVYISPRNIPTETSAIKVWMIQTALDYHPQNINIDSSQTAHPATICKIAWASTELD